MRNDKVFNTLIAIIIISAIIVLGYMMYSIVVLGAHADAEIAGFTRTGSLYIPHTGTYTEWINEPSSCYWQGIVDGRASLLIDSPDFCQTPIITDHNYQDFSSLGNTQSGDEAVMILNDGSEITYRCIDVIEGENTAKDLLTLSWQSVFSVYDADLVLYTCHYNRFSVNGVLIAVWQECEATA